MTTCDQAHESVREWRRALPCQCTTTRCLCTAGNRPTEVVYATLTRWPCIRTGPHTEHVARHPRGGTTVMWDDEEPAQ